MDTKIYVNHSFINPCVPKFNSTEGSNKSYAKT